MHAMKTNASLLTLCAVFAASLSAPAVEKPNVHETGSVKIPFTLTAAGTFSATAKMKVVANAKVGRQSRFVINADGIPAGTYSLSGTRNNGGNVNLGDFTVRGSSRPGGGGFKGSIAVPLPQGINGESIQSVTIEKSGDTPLVITGDAGDPIVNWNYTATVRITPGTASASGHVSSRSVIKQNVETKRKFVLVGFGAPANMELTVHVDGVEVGMVTSAANGKVTFSALPDEIVLRNITTVTLTRANGNVVMSAHFIF
jgi:hypothetical protein